MKAQKQIPDATQIQTELLTLSSIITSSPQIRRGWSNFVTQLNPEQQTSLLPIITKMIKQDVFETWINTSFPSFCNEKEIVDVDKLMSNMATLSGTLGWVSDTMGSLNSFEVSQQDDKAQVVKKIDGMMTKIQEYFIDFQKYLV